MLRHRMDTGDALLRPKVARGRWRRKTWTRTWTWTRTERADLGKRVALGQRESSDMDASDTPRRAGAAGGTLERNVDLDLDLDLDLDKRRVAPGPGPGGNRNGCW